MKKKVLSTLAIGDLYMSMACTMMSSTRRFLGDDLLYVVFCANADIVKFAEAYCWIDFQQINIDIPIRNKFTARRYKGAPLVHNKYLGYDMLFMDADTIVYSDKIMDLFRIVSEKDLLLYGALRDDSYVWFKGADGEEFNMVCYAEAKGLGTVGNFTINSGIIGRTNSKVGIEFAEYVDKLLRDESLVPFEKGIYYNDEPYVSIAYQKVCRKYGVTDIFTPLNTEEVTYYCTTAAAEISVHDDSEDRVKILRESNGTWLHPEIVHYVAGLRFRHYRDRITYEMESRNLPVPEAVSSYS